MTQRVMILLGLLLVALPAYGGETEGGTPLVFGAWRTHVSRTLGITLAVPDAKGAPVAVVEESFPWARRGVQFEHSLTLAGGRLRIEVFTDPDEKPIEAWLELHFGFLLDERALVWTTKLADGPAVVVQQPRMPGSFARRTTALRIGMWTLLATCEGLDDPDNATLCDAVVGSLRAALPEELVP